MAKNGKTKKGKLRPRRVVHVPLREVSGVCLRRGRKGRMSLVAVGDRVAKLAWCHLPRNDSDAFDWRTTKIKRFPGSELPKRDPQIEAICSDGAGRVFLLQEAPARVEIIDLEKSRLFASIELAVTGRDALARNWADPAGSRGEGMALLRGGHLLIAKEKHPAAFIEFGPPGARPRGLVPGGALPDGNRWPIKKGRHKFVALAIWHPDPALAAACADFSDMDVGPDGRLYLLSDKSATIARIDDLAAGGGVATLSALWRLGKLDGKPEGLAFTAKGRAIVALDSRKPRRNLLLLRRRIAAVR